MAKTTHIIAILDRSGSMYSLAGDVIGNFNAFLKEQQSVPGKAKLTLVIFDDRYEMIYDKIDLQDAKPLTEETYFVRGSTAMYDAVGKTLTDMQSKKQAIVLINTDGYENCSHEYRKDTIKSLVDNLRKKWEFIFVGADIDASAEGGAVGFAHNLGVAKSSAGVTRAYSAMNATTTAYRAGGLEASAQAFAAVVNSTEDEVS